VSTPPNDPRSTGARNVSRPGTNQNPGAPPPGKSPSQSGVGKPAASKSGVGGDWKRHMLVRVGAQPVELKVDTPFVMGRSEDTDLPIPSNRVSRRHAEIFWKSGRPFVKDLGSQNGTLVNGKRVMQEHQLEDNDELTVGPFLCTYRCMTGVGSVGKSAIATDTNALTQPMLADAMAGRLDLVNLFELLQTLEFNQKTGTLDVFGTESCDGQIIVKDGAPIYARTEAKTGEEAIFELVMAKSGQFSFSPASEQVTRNVTRPMTSILLEAGRRMDEKAGG
jgi:pSer/pThr/pTyr-binding forkhead associated (FHA) protein